MTSYPRSSSSLMDYTLQIVSPEHPPSLPPSLPVLWSVFCHLTEKEAIAAQSGRAAKSSRHRVGLFLEEGLARSLQKQLQADEA